MQVFDENDKLVLTKTGSMKDLLAAAGKMNKAAEESRKPLPRIKIGELPQVGMVLELNNLLFRVSNVSKKTGYVGMHLLRP
jgi:hypothetical protein